MSSSRLMRAGVLAVAVGVVLSCVSAFFGVRLLDEGYILYNSWLLTQGAMPYRDFFILYPPGMFILIAAIMKLCGPSAIAARITILVCGLVVARLVYLLCGRFTDKGTAAVYSGLSLIWGVPIYNTPFPNWYALALLLSGLWVLCRRDDASPSVKGLLVAGILVGLACTIKQSIGVLAVVGYVALIVVTQPRPVLLKGIGAFVAGLALPIGVMAMWLHGIGVLSQFFLDVVVFPFTHRGDIVASVLPALSTGGVIEVGLLFVAIGFGLFARPAWLEGVRLSPRMMQATALAGALLICAFVLRFGWFQLFEVLSGAGWSLVFYGSVLLAGAGIVLVVRRRPVGTQRALALGSLMLAGVMFFEAGGALDWSHLFYVIPPMLIFAAWFFGEIRSSLTNALLGALALGLAAGALSSVMLGFPGGWNERVVALSGSMSGVVTSVSEARVLDTVADELRTASPNTTVFVYPVDAGLYFLSQRRTPTRHSQYVHRLNAAELADEHSRLTADPPSVVVARVPRPGETIGYSRWSQFGRPVFESSIENLRVVRKIGDFVVYADNERRVQ